ncbi:uncharacterized protein JN550_005596 [Neoarthrinium moseri]|uniref:uncharacterized protein n=1 Tax=Neoarthrinium moseri TaxID=1658444 RepID=UPI001FDCCCFC|nr:uncharacterized protein JN550_005596 [Neoarthrinium moseri]KAI1870006.1 hypothetical protein JN550_005596 [Neoarthrinium moseri]
MIAALVRSLPPLRRKWKPLNFSNTSFTQISPDQKIEEETFPDYVASRYYPAHIGETFVDRYQIVGKLGFGASSIVWLARDLRLHSHRRHVVLKLYVNSDSMGKYLDDELNTYRRMEKGSKQHPGYNAVRSLLDSFHVDGPGGQHRCLVHPPLWESISAFLRRNPVLKLPPPVLAFVLRRLFLALDFLHRECQIIHTDIKADNIMFGIQDDSVFEAFEEEELQNPSPRKVLTDRAIYASRALTMPREWGSPVLCDFGSAVSGETEHVEDIQPDIYRAPEVILQIPWTYSVDIWNVGCMIWDVFEGGHLFTGRDPEAQTYRSRAHLAEMIALLGHPSPDLLARGGLSHEFFSPEGNFSAKVGLPDRVSLEEREAGLEGRDKESFLRLMRKMVEWEPSKRCSAKELADDEWIQKNL